MRYRLLGHSGLRVSELFLGTMTFGEDWGWGAPPEECRRILDAYLDAGGNVVDTANAYTAGASERIVGELVAARRDYVVLSTKFTLTNDPADPNASGGHRKNLTRSLEQSLRRLRTDRVDLYWVHIWDPRTPLEETMRALDDAVRAGKILYVGISDTPAWVVSRADALAALKDWTAPVAVQLPYSLVRRDAERELLPMAAGLGISVAAWSPLAGGILSGKFTAPPAGEPQESGSPAESGGPQESGGRRGAAGSTRVDASTISERDLRIARTVREVATEIGATPSQVAIGWTMSRHPTLHPVLGARRLDQLTDNLGAAALTLRPSDVERLDAASAIDIGFPTDFIADTQTFVYGPVGERVAAR